eukprot:s54_g2.t1
MSWRLATPGEKDGMMEVEEDGTMEVEEDGMMEVEEDGMPVAVEPVVVEVAEKNAKEDWVWAVELKNKLNKETMVKEALDKSNDRFRAQLDDWSTRTGPVLKDRFHWTWLQYVTLHCWTFLFALSHLVDLQLRLDGLQAVLDATMRRTSSGSGQALLDRKPEMKPEAEERAAKSEEPEARKATADVVPAMPTGPAASGVNRRTEPKPALVPDASAKRSPFDPIPEGDAPKKAKTDPIPERDAPKTAKTDPIPERDAPKKAKTEKKTKK